MGTVVARWVRLGIAVTLGGPQLVIGLWAVMAPKNWFESFPGFDPRLAAAAPPYNEHLVTDVGAGFLATGIVLLVAALWANRAAIGMALLAFVAFTVPHVVYHATNPADALTGFEDVLNTVTLASGLVLAAVFAWGLRTAGHPAAGADRAHGGRRPLETVTDAVATPPR
jgi:hypothetical protein